jgi:hypothetical protein
LIKKSFWDYRYKLIIYCSSQAIVEDIDEDGSGKLEFEEFVMLSAR